MRPLKLIAATALPAMLSGCTMYYPPYPPYPPDYGYAYPYPYPPSPDYANAGYPPPGAQQGGEEPYCREYMHKVQIEDHMQEVYGTACRAPDGTWKIID